MENQRGVYTPDLPSTSCVVLEISAELQVGTGGPLFEDKQHDVCTR